MYNHNLIEKKWQKYWKENKTFQFFDNVKQKKYYVLDMFPYPSGQGLHVGHPKGYTATDIVSRYKRLNNFSVLHPIGWDAFGLPAEQYAIQTNNHPELFTEKNINNFRIQLQSLGFDYDCNKEVNTTKPEYYQWTQWIFSQLYKNGLAKNCEVEVNWCEGLGTVLANEEVLNVNGKMVSERGNFPVVKKPMRQWVLKITDYAEKLLDGLNEVDWPESLKSIQRKWIGKSEGTIINFKHESGIIIPAFTTRADTIYGVTYLALAPEYKNLLDLVSKDNREAVIKYIEEAKSKTNLERQELNKDKTGVFLGTYVVNPISNEKVPLYVADYVLSGYGTGAVMGSPAHCERDFDFAKKYNIETRFIIETKDHNKAYELDGKHINSPLIDGLDIKQSIEKIQAYLIKNDLGKKQVNYHLMDWLFSRQRYWGEPFPIAFDEENQTILITDLPVVLPKLDDFKPSADGQSPLAKLTDWVNITINGKKYRRETNTMPQWAGSCWYYLAYILKQPDGSYIPLNSKEAYKLFERWLPVDLYIGGQEHAVLHLLYARFWHRFLYDIGVVPTKEPFQRIINQGMILGSNGEKMSKSKGNVINPDDIVKSHGADALRLYEMFMGPINASLPWTDEGLNGVRKWLDRVERLYSQANITQDATTNKEFNFAYHHFIKTISDQIESYQFNTAISSMMIFINECYKEKTIPKLYLESFLIVLSCFCPHLAEELWSNLGNKPSVCLQTWPKYDPQALVKNEVKLPVMENSKLRSVIEVSKDASEQEVMNIVETDEKLSKVFEGKKIKKVIYVKGKILNIIV